MSGKDCVLEAENEYLQQTYKYVEWELDYIDRRFAGGIEAADEAAEESVRQMLERRYRQLLLVRDTPYFARIDFTPRGEPPCGEQIPNDEQLADGERLSSSKCYLGKATITDDERSLLVVDWRAPVASLYYECRLGDAAYESPEHYVTGELHLKRQYTINERRLASYEDIDITSDDELLRPYLSVSADARLKNIISTIQSEQNAIIRAPLEVPLIIQGAAGSGKTTVALHRIAWMVYTFAKKFSPSTFLILAPNKFFLNYISHILPDLGVDDVPQKTFEELMREHTKIRMPAEEPAAALERIMNGGAEEAKTAAYKSSLQCKEDMDEFLRTIEDAFIPRGPLYISGIPMVAEHILREMFLDDRAHLSFKERLAWMQKRISLLLSDSVLGKAAAKEYVKGLTLPKPSELYADFCASKGIELAKKLKTEDFTPLLYLWMKINGIDREMKQMRHIILDEAQDASMFQLCLLREMYPNASFTILGDLAQGLYAYRGLTDWDAVNTAVWEGKAHYRTLRRSYRTTVEIMAYANEIISAIPGMSGGEAVIRHGDEVRTFSTISDKERVWCIAERVNYHQVNGHKNIAVITRTAAYAHELAKTLPRAGFSDFTEITEKESVYDGGVSILSAAMSKGLEFDAVILAGMRDYSNESLDLHLKYVACTRAMHCLDVIE